ncbi:MAG: hypothetical protein OQK98_08250 [Gammaproteobacteria bacterium]|nr:hypothetical protein [Gammaproteobacteria bacterium]
MDKISITKIVSNAFIIPWNNLFFYSCVLSVPILILVSVWSVWLVLAPYNPYVSSPGFLVYCASYAYLAITCHRLILTKNKTLKQLLAIDIKQFIRFIILATIVYALSLAVRLVIVNIYVNLFNDSIQADTNLEIAEYIAYLPSMYIIARFCIIFPAVALGYKPKLAWAWNATRKYHLHILFIVALFPWALEIIIYALYRENSTLVEQLFITFLTYISTVIGVFAISLTYNELYEIEHKKL